MKFHHISLPVSFALVFIFSLNAFTQTWEFAKERDGIKVYTRKEANSSLKSFKGVAILHTSMDKMKTMIGNVENTGWWDENVRDIKVLASEKDKFIRYYLIYHVPWPFTDRDLCVEAKITDDPVTGIRTVYAEPVPNLVPDKPNLIRITKYWQKWTIQPIGKNSVLATLEGFVDPAGNVPSWLYNMVIVDSPLKVFRGIKARVENP